MAVRSLPLSWFPLLKPETVAMVPPEQDAVKFLAVATLREPDVKLHLLLSHPANPNRNRKTKNSSLFDEMSTVPK